MTHLNTPLCPLLGIEAPIVQAPIGGAATPALAAAVSNAGGLGMLVGTWQSPDALRETIRETHEKTDRPFGVNFVLEWEHQERLTVCLEEGVRIISFAWGDPSPYRSLLSSAGVIVMHTVGSAEEARRSVDAGTDILVAQGWEAGGHVWGTVSTLALVPRVVDAVGSTPVVAAGGIADGRGLAAVIALGAAGAWMGTRFVASDEAGVDPSYQQAIIAAAETDTIHSTVFDVGWPHAPHRTLHNSTVKAWEAAGSLPSGQRPGEDEAVATWPDGSPIPRYHVTLPGSGMGGNLEALAQYAGQGCGLVTNTEPAGAIVHRIVDEAIRMIEANSRLLRSDSAGT